MLSHVRPHFHYPTYDANGNVSEYIDSSGSIVAHYEYSPFGRGTVASGTMAASFAFRFSTKYVDSETALYYYGYRYYDPRDGRWMSRDPIGERGGDLLHGFVLNSPLDVFDPLGLDPLTWQDMKNITQLRLPADLAISEMTVPQAIGLSNWAKADTNPDYKATIHDSVGYSDLDSAVAAWANYYGPTAFGVTMRSEIGTRFYLHNSRYYWTSTVKSEPGGGRSVGGAKFADIPRGACPAAYIHTHWDSNTNGRSGDADLYRPPGISYVWGGTSVMGRYYGGVKTFFKFDYNPRKGEVDLKVGKSTGTRNLLDGRTKGWAAKRGDDDIPITMPSLKGEQEEWMRQVERVRSNHAKEVFEKTGRKGQERHFRIFYYEPKK